jgi:hypothetical protein
MLRHIGNLGVVIDHRSQGQGPPGAIKLKPKLSLTRMPISFETQTLQGQGTNRTYTHERPKARKNVVLFLIPRTHSGGQCVKDSQNFEELLGRNHIPTGLEYPTDNTAEWIIT